MVSWIFLGVSKFFLILFFILAHQYNVEIHSADSDIPLRSLGKLEVTLEGEGGLNETFSITE